MHLFNKHLLSICYARDTIIVRLGQALSDVACQNLIRLTLGGTWALVFSKSFQVILVCIRFYTTGLNY